MDRGLRLRVEPLSFKMFSLWASRSFVLCTVVSLFGCGSDPKSPTLNETQLSQPSSTDLPPLVCDTPNCSSLGLAQLVTLGLRGPAYCTASRLSDDRILTASHCLTGDLHVNGQLTRCWVRFADKEQPHPPLIPCSRIIGQTELDNHRETVVQRDTAVVEIPAMPPASGMGDRRLPTLNTDSVRTPSAWAGVVRLFGIKIDSSPHRVVEELCWATTVAPESARKKGDAWSLFMPDCPIEPGYSGGPINALRGPLLGVISYRETRVAIGTRITH